MMNKTFAVVILASASLCALFCVSWWGDVFSERNASPIGFSEGSSIAASSAPEASVAEAAVNRGTIQRHQHSGTSSSDNVASAPVGINLPE